MSTRRQFLFIAIATLIGFVSLAPPVVADATRPAILEARVSKIIDALLTIDELRGSSTARNYSAMLSDGG